MITVREFFQKKFIAPWRPLTKVALNKESDYEKSRWAAKMQLVDFPCEIFGCA